MRNSAESVMARIVWPTGPGTRRCRPRQHSRPRDSRPTNRTDTDLVPAASPAPDPQLARARFARFVSGALRSARDRGMTDKDIAAATGIGASTFHRWRRGGADS